MTFDLIVSEKGLKFDKEMSKERKRYSDDTIWPQNPSDFQRPHFVYYVLYL